jgi:hypothetical protein
MDPTLPRLRAVDADALEVAVVVTATPGRAVWVWSMTPSLLWVRRMLLISTDARPRWAAAAAGLRSVEVLALLTMRLLPDLL